jgi:hypothetical protein
VKSSGRNAQKAATSAGESTEEGGGVGGTVLLFLVIVVVVAGTTFFVLRRFTGVPVRVAEEELETAEPGMPAKENLDGGKEEVHEEGGTAVGKVNFSKKEKKQAKKEAKRADPEEKSALTESVEEEHDMGI